MWAGTWEGHGDRFVPGRPKCGPEFASFGRVAYLEGMGREGKTSGLLGGLEPQARGQMVARAAAELEKRALLWDVGHLSARALAFAAHRRAADRRRLREGLDVGLALDRALGSLADGPPPFNVEGAAFERAALEFGFPGAAAAAACRAVNRAPELERRAFWGLVIAGRPLDDVAHELGGSAARTARAARALLDRFFGVLVTPGPPDLVIGGPSTDPESSTPPSNHGVTA